MIDWIKENQNILSIRGIEKFIGMPDSTLTKAVNGSQSLPKKWEKPLEEFITKLRDSVH
jgi:hypothetical protein